VYSNNGISTLHSSVQLRCRLHYCVEKLFITPPHFGMTPPKSGGPCKMWGVLKKICSLCSQKLDPPTFKSVATPLTLRVCKYGRTSSYWIIYPPLLLLHSSTVIYALFIVLMSDLCFGWSDINKLNSFFTTSYPAIWFYLRSGPSYCLGASTISLI